MDSPAMGWAVAGGLTPPVTASPCRQQTYVYRGVCELDGGYVGDQHVAAEIFISPALMVKPLPPRHGRMLLVKTARDDSADCGPNTRCTSQMHSLTRIRGGQKIPDVAPQNHLIRRYFLERKTEMVAPLSPI